MTQEKKGYIFILLSTFLFSSMEVALKLISNEFNPIQLTFLRFFIGTLVLSPLAIKKIKIKKISFHKNDYIFFALEGLICVVVSMSFYQLSLLYSKASDIAILFSCNPIFILPLAYFILKEKIYKHTIISMILSIIGILCILNVFNFNADFRGFIFCIFSTIAFSLYSVIGKLRMDKFGGIVLTFFSFIMGSLELLLLIVITRFSMFSNWFLNHNLKTFANIPILKGITLHSLPFLIYVGIFVTGLGYCFYFLSMEFTSATTASLVFYIKPALASIIACIILKETILINVILGIILIGIGSGITFISNNKISKTQGSDNKFSNKNI